MLVNSSRISCMYSKELANDSIGALVSDWPLSSKPDSRSFRSARFPEMKSGASDEIRSGLMKIGSPHLDYHIWNQIPGAGRRRIRPGFLPPPPGMLPHRDTLPHTHGIHTYGWLKYTQSVIFWGKKGEWREAWATIEQNAIKLTGTAGKVRSKHAAAQLEECAAKCTLTQSSTTMCHINIFSIWV